MMVLKATTFLVHVDVVLLCNTTVHVKINTACSMIPPPARTSTTKTAATSLASFGTNRMLPRWTTNATKFGYHMSCPYPNQAKKPDQDGFLVCKDSEKCVGKLPTSHIFDYKQQHVE